MPGVDKLKIEKTTISDLEQKRNPNNVYDSLVQLTSKISNSVVETLDLDIHDKSNTQAVAKEYLSSIILSSNDSPEQILKEYQTQLQKELNSVHGTRNRAVVAAKFLSTEFPKMPYFWGGGHDKQVTELKGIDLNWGKLQTVTVGGSHDYKVGNQYLYSLDCSGFVSWCLVNGGYSLNQVKSSTEFKNMGKQTPITDQNILKIAKPGDLAWLDGHIGIIIDVNKTNEEITVAHVSGSGGGMNITTQSTKTGKIVKDDIGANYNINVKDENNKPLSIESRVGENYFTHVISVSYPD